MCLFRFHGMVQQALAFCAYHVPSLQEDLFSGACWHFKRSELLCSELSPVNFLLGYNFPAALMTTKLRGFMTHMLLSDPCMCYYL